MTKTTKKLDNSLIKALTQVCEIAKQQLSGFEWLTHSVNHGQFPGSLLITCVFDTNLSLQNAQQTQGQVFIAELVQQQLLTLGIVLKDTQSHIAFDTEQACQEQHGGRWKSRLI
jgi:hypothetical protein